ncbi:MAG: hypothetical protein GY835_19870, partial [bacterium]|nr:hypothetical protein [bacterium]
RKKGKTALLQRFFNILYTRNDPQLIPFYYRIPEKLQTQSDFTRAFYRKKRARRFATPLNATYYINRKIFNLRLNEVDLFVFQVAYFQLLTFS